jgi:hypothetical protein
MIQRYSRPIFEIGTQGTSRFFSKLTQAKAGDIMMSFDTRTVFDLTYAEIFVRYGKRFLIALSILVLPLLLFGILLKPSVPSFALLIFMVIALGRKRIGSVLGKFKPVDLKDKKMEREAIKRAAMKKKESTEKV